MKKRLSAQDQERVLQTLKGRFEQHPHRHAGLDWQSIQKKLITHPEKIASLDKMEETGGEPDVVDFNCTPGTYCFCDCAAESPKGRRSVCYDQAALKSRKEHKPAHSAAGMAAEIGIRLLTEEEYRQLQQLGKFDTKTSSWIATPEPVRQMGGAIFGDFRYGRVFIYHNGAESYYAARGFRGILEV